MPPRRAMSITGSELLDCATVTINDKQIVVALKDFLRKCGGKVSGKKADLLDRFQFVSGGAIIIIDNNFAQGKVLPVEQQNDWERQQFCSGE